MYKLKVYKYGRFSHEITGKKNILPRLAADLACKHITKTNKASIVIYFNSDKYSEKYILPITCKTYIEQLEKGEK